MGDDPIATWKSKIKLYSDNIHFKDMNRIDGMPTEFGWKIFTGITTLGFLEKIQSLMRGLQWKPEAPDHLETMEILAGPSIQTLIPMHSNG